MRLNAQEDDNSIRHQFWTDFNVKYKIKPGLSVQSPIGYRTISPHTWDRLYINPQVHYDWPRLILKKMKYKEQLIGGLGTYFTNNVINSNKLEIRPFQGYSISAPNREHLVIKYFLQLEERFELNTHNWDNNFGLRFRLKASATIKFNGDVWDDVKGFYIPISLELFWNLLETEQFNDNARVNLGLGRSFDDKWQLAIFLGYNYSRESIEDQFKSNDIIYRLRAYYTIPKKE